MSGALPTRVWSALSDADVSGTAVTRAPGPSPTLSSLRAAHGAMDYCYTDGAGWLLGSPQLLLVALRGVRPSADCAGPLRLRACDDASNSSSSSGAQLLCVSPLRFVRLVDQNNLTCPVWSTAATQGRAALDVDASFAAFWGCRCPDGTYWGHAPGTAGVDVLVAAEQADMASDAPWAVKEAALSRRACHPCSSGLAVHCSPRTSVDALHELDPARSLYPLPFRSRRLLPYTTATLPCLHPQVCNVPAAPAPDWVLLFDSAAAAAVPQAESSFQCREGHDPESLLCSRCLRGYWPDGFLCERCAGAARRLHCVAAGGGGAHAGARVVPLARGRGPGARCRSGERRSAGSRARRAAQRALHSPLLPAGPSRQLLASLSQRTAAAGSSAPVPPSC